MDTRTDETLGQWTLGVWFPITQAIALARNYIFIAVKNYPVAVDLIVVSQYLDSTKLNC